MTVLACAFQNCEDDVYFFLNLIHLRRNGENIECGTCGGTGLPDQ